MAGILDIIMEKFLEEPELELHIRQLAKSLKISPTTVGKYADALEKEGFLQKKKISNHIFLKASLNPAFAQKKREWNMSRLHGSGLISYLSEELNPEAIIAYGPYAKGQDRPKSIISIALMTPLKKHPDMEKFSARLKRPINLLLISRSDLDHMKENMKENDRELLNNLINGTVVSGFWEAFT